MTFPLPDGDLFNQFAATLHLTEAAHDWARLARDESLPDEVRVQAALRARAIRQEMGRP
jgi:hypothetical protein